MLHAKKSHSLPALCLFGVWEGGSRGGATGTINDNDVQETVDITEQSQEGMSPVKSSLENYLHDTIDLTRCILTAVFQSARQRNINAFHH
jgi:hypothetical protein